jgi:hypothetical protein
MAISGSAEALHRSKDGFALRLASSSSIVDPMNLK